MKRFALATVQHPTGRPSLDEAARQLGVGVDDLDAAFGVVLVDPRRGLYGVQVDARCGLDGDGDDGPYSNPPIGPLDT